MRKRYRVILKTSWRTAKAPGPSFPLSLSTSVFPLISETILVLALLIFDCKSLTNGTLGFKEWEREEKERLE
uniref:Uncharacterized protein n=1 Tax=Amphimedon queenslandica TaxID=400682 RepID=A0A1X7VSB6_AMPQE